MPTTIVRLATAAALSWSAGLALAQTVTPPPLPPGSNLVRPTAGLNADEKKRYVRAHHHKMQNGRDYTKDDSVSGGAAGASGMGSTQAAGAAAGARSGGAAAATLGGAGTGPAREKTDKGASSYFFGNNKK